MIGSLAIGQSRIAFRWLSLLIPVCVLAAAAQGAQDRHLNGPIQQRLTLASQLIQRMHEDERAALSEELELLQARFLQAVDDALADDVDSFFRRVSASYRERPGRALTGSTELHRQRYEKKLEELAAFRQSYEALAAERGDAVWTALDRSKFLARIEQAQSAASKGEFQKATALADSAYHQVVSAFHALRNNETVEYRLDFSKPEDEYEYEKRRFESMRMLVDMLVDEEKTKAESFSLIKAMVSHAATRMQTAEQLAIAGRYAEAISEQEGAIMALTRALRLAGVYF